MAVQRCIGPEPNGRESLRNDGDRGYLRLARGDHSGPRCVLYLWATPPKLSEATAVISEWGFTYVTGAVWDKGQQGLGSWFRLQHEHLLIATRVNDRLKVGLSEFW